MFLDAFPDNGIKLFKSFDNPNGDWYVCKEGRLVAKCWSKDDATLYYNASALRDMLAEVASLLPDEKQRAVTLLLNKANGKINGDMEVRE